METATQTNLVEFEFENITNRQLSDNIEAAYNMMDVFKNDLNAIKKELGQELYKIGEEILDKPDFVEKNKRHIAWVQSGIDEGIAYIQRAIDKLPEKTMMAVIVDPFTKKRRYGQVRYLLAYVRTYMQSIRHLADLTYDFFTDEVLDERSKAFEIMCNAVWEYHSLPSVMNLESKAHEHGDFWKNYMKDHDNSYVLRTRKLWIDDLKREVSIFRQVLSIKKNFAHSEVFLPYQFRLPKYRRIQHTPRIDYTHIDFNTLFFWLNTDIKSRAFMIRHTDNFSVAKYVLQIMVEEGKENE